MSSEILTLVGVILLLIVALAVVPYLWYDAKSRKEG